MRKRLISFMAMLLCSLAVLAQEFEVDGYNNDSGNGSMPETISQQSVENYKIGDVNCDGYVDIADAVCIVNYIVDKPNTAFVVANADVNGDGSVDIADAVRVVNFLVGKISSLALPQISETEGDTSESGGGTPDD